MNLLDQVLARTRPSTEAIETYQGQLANITRECWPAERLLPGVGPRAKILTPEVEIFPVGPVLVVACPASKMVQLRDCDFAVSAHPSHPTFMIGPLSAFARGQVKPMKRPVFDHETTHILQILSGQTWTVEEGLGEVEAAAALLDKFRMEFDAYFIEMTFHPQVLEEVRRLGAPISDTPLMASRAALWRSYISTLEDMASGTVMAPEMIPAVFSKLVQGVPEAASTWGVSAEDIEWWLRLNHPSLAACAVEGTKQTRNHMAICRALLRNFGEGI